jgi:tRNA 2-thiouridine synthesizing protein A
MAEYTLDITALTCPMTFVKAKLRLEQLAVGDHLTIRVREGEAAVNVPRSLADHGQRIVRQCPTSDGCVEIEVQKLR